VAVFGVTEQHFYVNEVEAPVILYFRRSTFTCYFSSSAANLVSTRRANLHEFPFALIISLLPTPSTIFTTSTDLDQHSLTTDTVDFHRIVLTSPCSMDDEAALHAKIAALKGQINEHKQTSAHPYPYQGFQHSQSTRGSHRWGPYPRGGRGGFAKPHKNRTLVVSGAQNGTIASPGGDTTGSIDNVALPPAKHAFISTRGAKVNQLMTRDVFAREQKQRQEFQETHPTFKRPKPNRGPSGDAQVAKPTPRHLEIDGIRFQLKDDGSKLIRVPGQSPLHDKACNGLKHLDTENAGKETPKKAKIAEVEFFRTKNGNLIRVAAQNSDHRYCQERVAPIYVQDSPFYPYRPARRAPKAQCENFT
jgi:hypothetical protein